MRRSDLKPIFEYDSYKLYVNDLIKTYPKEGRGVFAKLAKSINVSSVLISKIFKGDNDISLDQAIPLCNFFELDSIETDYMICLINIERAGTKELKKFFEQKQYEIQVKALDIKARINKQNEISNEAMNEFYSSWIYTGIRQSCALEEVRTTKDLSELYRIPEHVIKEKVSFLLKNDLLKEEEGSLVLGVNSTHLSKSNPLVNSHRRNWRLKAIDSFANNDPSDLFFVAPMVISEDIAIGLREKLLQVIKELYEDAPKGEAEVTCCLNIDLFRF